MVGHGFADASLVIQNARNVARSERGTQPAPNSFAAAFFFVRQSAAATAASLVCQPSFYFSSPQAKKTTWALRRNRPGGEGGGAAFQCRGPLSSLPQGLIPNPSGPAQSQKPGKTNTCPRRKSGTGLAMAPISHATPKTFSLLVIWQSVGPRPLPGSLPRRWAPRKEAAHARPPSATLMSSLGRRRSVIRESRGVGGGSVLVGLHRAKNQSPAHTLTRTICR